MIYQAMIGPIGYLETRADNEDEARVNFSIQLHHRGAGIYERWRDSGMAVKIFKNPPTKEERGNGRKRVFDRVHRTQVHG